MAIPKQNETFYLIISAKLKEQEDREYKLISKFILIRTESNQNDGMKFCSTYGINAEYSIFAPIELNLKQHQIYEFEYFIKDALKVAFIDDNNGWFYLERSSDRENIWTLKRAFETLGKITLYAKLEEKLDFGGICFYMIVP